MLGKAELGYPVQPQQSHCAEGKKQNKAKQGFGCKFDQIAARTRECLQKAVIAPTFEFLSFAFFLFCFHSCTAKQRIFGREGEVFVHGLKTGGCSRCTSRGY